MMKCTYCRGSGIVAGRNEYEIEDCGACKGSGLRREISNAADQTVTKGNPKDAVGSNKAPVSTVSRRVLHELGLAMLEGECQYWRHNYRAVSVRAMVYVDALERHLSAWIEGQDIDPDSGLSHLVKAMACLAIIRDAQLYGSLIDDRPPAQKDLNWIKALNEKAMSIVETKSSFVRGAYTEANRKQWPEFSEALSSGPIKKGNPPGPPHVIDLENIVDLP